ncbi:MAG: DUF192 domain-containing protein [Actinomycetota bacterium]|nr:DUF192 domain-containing protein [Actinomycetota bacterium]
MTRWWPRLTSTAVAFVLIAGCTSGGGAADRVALPGFGETAYRVARGGATVKKGCALLATTEAQQSHGLMNVRDLKGYDGMVFAFPTDTTVGFYMKDTPMALSIAWFDGNGRFVSGADMAPGRVEPSYFAAAPYRYAFEVPRGKLGLAGIGPDTTLTIGGDC